MLIPNGRDAFLMRIAMIEAAEKSLDLQYYSIRNDTTGQLILEALLKAADRGVRVLIDDLNLEGADKTLAVLNQHRYVEVRVFNPFATERDSLLTRLSNGLSNLGHFLRRMHNKAFIVDNRVAVTGGRNLADEYFDLSDEFNFHDLDTLAAGPVVTSISRSFDAYWNSNESYPINAMHPRVLKKDELDELRASLDEHWEAEKQAGELRQLIPLNKQIEEGNVKLIWARAELAADDPRKISQPEETARSKPQERIDRLADASRREFVIVSPYFIPGDDGVEWLASLVRDGVRVRVLTNSLAATDVVAVHGAYRDYSKALLAAGVELYELKPYVGLSQRRGLKRHSRASLHTKAYVVDRRSVVIGSYNFDHRSERLNTELVLVIHSPELADQVIRHFERVASPENSYRLSLEDGHIVWDSAKDGIPVHQEQEPDAGFLRKMKSGFISLFPIDNQL